jgi:hypothetical protein
VILSTGEETEKPMLMTCFPNFIWEAIVREALLHCEAQLRLQLRFQTGVPLPAAGRGTRVLTNIHKSHPMIISYLK